ncbi:Pentatricopeptide repeat-containing protein [Quillaja saponaria]|uniref:Pentatricopeptide repeat-containing protein n=1 Tax=Quillaja saponaria TaxID=32244 RepID=A0AAD7VM76_QUISA|nr:Pentatricopeptide repeat-containing protein [Quillaja saponaria]
MVRRNMIVQTLELHDKVLLKEIHGDRFTLHMLMRACVTEGRFEEAEEYFRKAMAWGVKLDAATYSIVVQVACKKPNSSVACKLLKEMRDLGWLPSEATYIV